jgi:hypothetical protein
MAYVYVRESESDERGGEGICRSTVCMYTFEKYKSGSLNYVYDAIDVGVFKRGGGGGGGVRVQVHGSTFPQKTEAG